MTEKKSFTSSVVISWDLFKKHFRFLVPAIAASAVVWALMQVLQKTTERYAFLSFLALVISTVASIAIALGWSHVVLKLVRHTKVSWADFQTNTKIWVNYFLARILYGVCTFVGIIMFVVPLFMIIVLGIHVAWFVIIGSLIALAGLVLVSWLLTRYAFISLIAVDNPRMNGWKLLKESAKITKGHMWKLFGFLLLIVLINIIGALVLFIGLVVTIPVTMMAKGYVYNHLKSAHHAE